MGGRNNREGPRGSRQVGGREEHSWPRGPRVDIAVIMSIKTSKFKTYGKDEGQQEAKVSKTVAVLVSIAT